MSMFNDIDWTVKGNEEQFPILKRPNCLRKESRKDIGRSLGPGDETKLYANRNYTPEGKWDSMATQMVQRFRGTGHPVFARASALSRGILRRLQGKETTHFNADSSNTELLFRSIHSANQLSIYGAIRPARESGSDREELANEDALETVSQEIPKTMNSHEVNSFASTPRNEQEFGNRLREILDNFESRSEVNQIAKKNISEIASGQSNQTHIKTWIMVLEVITLACREYTHPRNDPRSKVFAAIPGGTNLSFSTITELRLRSLLQADPK